MIVLDASFAVSLVMPDEVNTQAIEIIGSLQSEDAIAPAIWPLEIANAILSAVRRRRISENEIPVIALSLDAFGIAIDPVDIVVVFGLVLPLARKHALSVYDAAYLELAMRTGSRLATHDRRLAGAARIEGVELALALPNA